MSLGSKTEDIVSAIAWHIICIDNLIADPAGKNYDATIGPVSHHMNEVAALNRLLPERDRVMLLASDAETRAVEATRKHEKAMMDRAIAKGEHPAA